MWKARSPRPRHRQRALDVADQRAAGVGQAARREPRKNRDDDLLELVGVRRRREHDVGARCEHGGGVASGGRCRRWSWPCACVTATRSEQALHAGAGRRGDGQDAAPRPPAADTLPSTAARLVRHRLVDLVDGDDVGGARAGRSPAARRPRAASASASASTRVSTRMVSTLGQWSTTSAQDVARRGEPGRLDDDPVGVVAALDGAQRLDEAAPGACSRCSRRRVPGRGGPARARSRRRCPPRRSRSR